MKRIFAAVLLAALLSTQVLAASGRPGTSASAAILVDAGSGRVLYEQNAHERRLIASITKLMTALVAVESTPDLKEAVKIKREYTLAEGSSIYLKEGEEVSLECLLYGLLMASGNDAALAVAGGCAGDVETFVDWMNQRAADLGMADTHFANPNGLNDEAHYSTAYDMALLAREVMDNAVLAEIVGTKSITVDGRSFVNHNKLLWRYEGCVGMKTGYTDKAGRTLVSCAERDGQRLVAVTLNDPDDWKDHAALFDYGFATWPRHILARAGKRFRTVPVAGSLNRFVAVETASDVYYPLTAEERVRSEVALPECVEAPVEAGAVAGQVTFYCGGEEIGKTYLCYVTAVPDDRAGEGFFRRLIRALAGGDQQAAFRFWENSI